MFTREYLLQSDWYQERLMIKQRRDAELWRMNRDYVEQKMDALKEDETEEWASMQERIEKAEQMIAWVSSPTYLDRLQGTIGADWIHRGIKS